MRTKMIWGLVTLIILLIGVSVFLLLRNTETEPKTVYIDVEPSKDNPPSTEQGSGYWHDGEWHDNVHAVTSKVVEQLPINKVVEQLSINPFLMKDLPEHLKMPPEWDNFHYMEAYKDGEAKEKFEKRLKTIIEDVIENYNPKRPIEDVWPAFIEAERGYNAESPYSHLNPGVPGLGGYRGDWLYKQVWDFPEVFEIILYEEPDIDGSPGMWLDVYEIETGLLDPDWNRFNLPDGRVFRARDGYKYQFNLGYDKERGRHSGSLEFCRSDGSTAKLIVINLDTISDEELEQLSGRDYNINPYTGKPIAYPGRKY